MVVLGGLWWHERIVEKNQKNRSIFVLSTVLRRRLPFDGGIGSLLPIWLIVVFVY